VPRALDPDERAAAAVVVRLWTDCNVVPHDDGSEDSMYDLETVGGHSAAIEVVAWTDPSTRQAEKYWVDHLASPQYSDRLRRLWTFTFRGEWIDSERRNRTFPRLNPDDIRTRLERILVELEERGIYEIPDDLGDYMMHEELAGRKAEPAMIELFQLLGKAAEGAVAYEIRTARGGWFFTESHGLVGRHPPDDVVAMTLRRLTEGDYVDVLDKLERARQPERVAVVVFDEHRTDVGYSISTWPADAAPNRSPDLPSPLTALALVVRDGPRGWMYTSGEWHRV
jgi:hypothetical protein